MKKILLLLLVVGSAVISSCKEKSKEETTETVVPEGMMELDLSKYGYTNLIINLPDSGEAPLEIQPNGASLNIRVGKNFQLALKEGEGNLKIKKEIDIHQNDVYKLDKFIVEDTNAVIYSWHIPEGQPEYRFFMVKKLGNITYELEDVAGESFSLQACKRMFECAKSLRLKAPIIPPKNT